MDNKKIIFGTDGWRGLLDDKVNEANILRVAQAFSDYLKLKGDLQKVVIGYDGRSMSGNFALLIARVLKANQIEILLSDRIVPTPVVSFACIHNNCNAGVMITASHNPAQYNGIKFKSSSGSPFPTEETTMVESLIDSSEICLSGEVIPVCDLTRDYLSHLERLIDFKAITSANLRIAIDSMAGAGGFMLESLLKKHGIKAQTIFGIPQTDFDGRLAEPVEKNLKPLSGFLEKGNFSLGLATDGDADRLGVMTDKGNWMNVQETILYLAQYYIGTRAIAGPVVKTASVTDKVLRVFPDIEVADVQVGFKYVAEAMMVSGAAFGAEESGGFGFKEHLPERDGIFSGLIFIEMLAKSGFTRLEPFIAAKRKELGMIYYDRIDMENHNPGRRRLLTALAENPPQNIGNYKVIRTQSYYSSRGIVNGLKIRLNGNPRWLLLRVSETEPIVRIYAEAQNNKEVKELLKTGTELFNL